VHPGEPIFDRISALLKEKFAHDAQRGAKFIDPTAEAPYLLFFVRADARREADERFPELSDSELLTERFFGLRLRKDENFERVDPEQMLALRPFDGSPAGALGLVAKASSWKDEVRTIARERFAEGLADDEREKREDTLEERVRFLKQGYSHRRAQLMERRSELRDKMKEGRSGAEAEYNRIKRQQQELRERQDEAIEALRREVELIQPGTVEFFAHALVLPSEDSFDEKERDDEIEQIAMEYAMAHERERGAKVTDVSTPTRAQRAGLADWPGFDLLSEHPETGKRGIEVKGRASRGDIELSENEWSSAINHRDDYWLYVVFDCASTHPNLFPVKDPYERLVVRPKGGVQIDEQSIYRATDSAS
jgi:hypothetical protein